MWSASTKETRARPCPAVPSARLQAERITRCRPAAVVVGVPEVVTAPGDQPRVSASAKQYARVAAGATGSASRSSSVRP
ncbi:hypothetical protein SFUMM280S_02447 [Streptomyces fumanus]